MSQLFLKGDSLANVDQLNAFYNLSAQLTNATNILKANSNSIAIAETMSNFYQMIYDISLTGGVEPNSPAAVLNAWQEYTDVNVLL